MSTIKVADTYLDRMAAKAAADPSKAAIYQAKVDAKIATWIAAGRTVTNDGATITSYTIPTSSSGGGGSSSTGATGSTYTLSTSVDGVSGTANNDTISGIIGTTSTFSIGDSINGGSGTDVLNIIGITSTAAEFVSIDAVETINLRLLDASGQTQINATDWSGVTTLTNASSLVNTTLDVSGLTTSTDVTIYGNTDVNIGYSLTTTGGTANVTLVSVGSAGTATTIGSASATNTANFDLDEGDAGLLTAAIVEVQGTLNLARMEGGSGMATYTIIGSGNAALVTDDSVTSFNASAALGNIDITFSGASEVAAVGGAGNDTFRFGTTISNSDTVVGGAGTDTVTLTIGDFNRNLSTSGVESATITFSEAAGGRVQATASTVATYTFAAGTANQAAVDGIANGATIVLNDDDLAEVILDYASGATSTTIQVGSATGDVTISKLSATDVQSVTIVSVGGGSNGATAVITTATFDTDVDSIVYQTSGGDAALEVGDGGDASIGSATSLQFITNGSANINFDSNIAGGTSLASLSVATNGKTAASATLLAVSGTALTSITLNASAADITLGTVSLGNGSQTGTTLSHTMTLSQSGLVDLDTEIGAITSTGGINLTVNITTKSSGTTYIADVIMDKGTDAQTTGLLQNFSLGTLTIATAADVEIEALDLEAATAGAQITFGNITVGQCGGFDFGSASGISAENVANVDISSLSITVGASASSTFGNIETTGGLVGAIALSVGTASSARFGTMTASGIGAITVSVASAAQADFGNMSSETTIGAMELSGVDGADITFGTIGASGSVGAIAISGALDVTFGAITTTTLGTVNATAHSLSGALTLDLSGVTNAVEVKLGAATNTITSGVGNDVITLTSGVTGNDVIRFTATGQGTDNIIGFFAGTTGRDQIELGTAMQGSGEFRRADGTAIAIADDADLSTVITATGTTLAAADNVIVIGTAIANAANMLTFLNSGIAFASALAGSGGLVVVWTDGNSSSYVSLVHFDGAGSAGAVTMASASFTLANTTLAQLDGVTPGAFATSNFDFI